MLLRATFILSLLGLVLFSGCATCKENKALEAPPPWKFENFQRLGVEFSWFYADIQDMIFGVDYFCHIQNKFQLQPYADIQ
jgi:hypothetical protein